MARKPQTPRVNLKIRAPGYRFAGVHAGLKERKKKDLSLIVSDRPAKAAAFFTTNRLKAGPIYQGIEAARDGSLQAIVVNSGNANAATGKDGIRVSHKTAGELGKLLGIRPDRILVSSTGKIGEALDFKKISRALPGAVKKLSGDRLGDAAQGIMTTDRFPKVKQIKGKIGGKTFTVTGIAKGAGMIEPNMATMLAYILTDLDMSLSTLRGVLKGVLEKSFNAITVDGDMSTNDTVVLMANGTSKIPPLSPKSSGLRKFSAMVLEVCQALARMIVQDGEGATKVVEVLVKGAKSNASAKKVAYSIAKSQLVKTSFFGEDPNWGRIFAAVGYSGETLSPASVDIWYDSVPLVKRGRSTSAAQQRKARKIVEKPTFRLTVDLRQGSGTAQILTSDLTYEYVKINAEYST